MSEAWEHADDEDYRLVLAFLDQSQAFTDGFEVGWQYGRMKHGEEADFQQTVHAESQGQLLMAAKALGWSVRFEPLDETFCEMYATRGQR